MYSPQQIQDQQQKINRIFDILTALAFLVVAIAFMSYIQFNPNNPYLSEFDSYYHVKMAELIRDQGIPQTFPWLQFTILRDNYVDHQLLFHILLIPFVSILGPIMGAKIFEVLVVSLAFLLFYLILRDNKLKGAVWFALFALFMMSSDFYYRMNFIRDMGLSLLFMMGGLYVMFKKFKYQYGVLGILCYLYVLAYGGFMFLPILAVTYFVAQLLLGEKWDWKIPLIAIGGMIAGLLINPYFPKNIEFLFAQIFQTGLGAQQYTGGEWRPYDTWFWVTINYIPIIIFFLGITITLLKRSVHNAKTITIFIAALFFLGLVWKSKRFVEYSPFFLTLSGFLLLTPFVEEKIMEFKQQLMWKKIENLLFAGALLVLIPLATTFSLAEISRARNDTQTLFSMSALTKVHDYLIQNSQQGDIVFTDDWDVFPRYFFANSKDYYIVGLDPEFMNQYDGDPYPGEKGVLYHEFAQISSGNDSSHLERIKEHFRAKWVIVNADHQQFKQNLESQPSLFQEVFTATNDATKDTYPSAGGDAYYLFKVL